MLCSFWTRFAGHDAGAVGPLVPQQSPAEEVAGIHGNLQTFILQRAEWAVKEATPAALRAYVADLTELLKLRRSSLHMVQISSCIHRLGRVVSVVSMVGCFSDSLAHRPVFRRGRKALLCIANMQIALRMRCVHQQRSVVTDKKAKTLALPFPSTRGDSVHDSLPGALLLQRRNPLDHTDSYVEETPGFKELLSELSALAVEMASEMDGRAVPNVLWAMGQMRQNPCGTRFSPPICSSSPAHCMPIGDSVALPLISAGGASSHLSSRHDHGIPSDLPVPGMLGSPCCMHACGLGPGAAQCFLHGGVGLTSACVWLCAEGKLLEALCTRILGMCRNNNEHTLNAMGCAHIFWSFASLRVSGVPSQTHTSPCPTLVLAYQPSSATQLF